MGQSKLKNFFLLLSALLISVPASPATDIENFRFYNNGITAINPDGDINLVPIGTGTVNVSSDLTFLDEKGIEPSGENQTLHIANGVLADSSVKMGTNTTNSFSFEVGNGGEWNGSPASVINLRGTTFLQDTRAQGPFRLLSENQLQFFPSSGSNYMAFKAPSSLSGTTTFTLPNGDGTNGQVMGTNAAGILSWLTPVTPNGVQTISDKTLNSPILLTPTTDVHSLVEQSSTPSTPSAGVKKIYAKQNGKLYTLNSAGVETEVGAGGAGGINYITNGDAETDTTGWTTFNDAALGGGPADDINDFIQGYAGQLIGWELGKKFRYVNSGTAVGGLTSGNDYYVQDPIVAVNGLSLYLASSPGGSLIDLTSAGGSGTQNVYPYRMVDGTGGTSGTTWTRSTSSPLRGSASFLYTHPSSLDMGSGVCAAFTTDDASKGKVMAVDFDYLVSSGSFAAATSSTDGDVRMGVFDVTNSKYIEPSTSKLYSSSSVSDHVSTYFQLPTNSTSFRFCLYNSSVTTSAFVLKLDNFKISPSQYVYGTPITEWADYTPTVNGLGTGTGTANLAQWRRVGSSLELDIRWSKDGNNGTGSSNIEFTLPPGLMPRTTTSAKLSGYIGTSISGHEFCSGLKSTLSSVFTIDCGAGGILIGSDVPAGAYIRINITNIPIQGWSASTKMSDGYDGRQITASAFRITSAQTISSSASEIVFNSERQDDADSYDPATGRFTARSSGKYRACYNLQIIAGSTPTSLQTHIRKNGSSGVSYAFIINEDIAAAKRYTFFSCTTLDLVANDYLSVWGSSATADSSVQATGATSDVSSFFVEKLASPQTITPGDSSYFSVGGLNSGASITNSLSTIVFNNTIFDDTHSGYSTSTGRYTVSAPGLWMFCWRTGGTVNNSTSETFSTTLLVNSIPVYGSVVPGIGASVNVGGATTCFQTKMKAGDTAEVQARSSQSFTTGTSSSSQAFFGHRVTPF